MNNTLKGHLLALLTVFIWGTTFVSTKILLEVFQPVQILFLRFFLGWLALWLLCPRFFHPVKRSQEGLFAAAGLSGVCLYYLLENIALTFTSASSVGVIVSVAPFFTALLAWLVLKASKPSGAFFCGFALALAGITLLSYGGSAFSSDGFGDLLALLAAFCWAVYSLLTTRIAASGYPVVLSTRRIFFWGLLFMLPLVFLSSWQADLQRLVKPPVLFNLLFLGLGASALCFVTWNAALNYLGAVQTSVYIYLVPLITVVASRLVLREAFSWQIGLGLMLTLAGLFLSQKQPVRKGGI